MYAGESRGKALSVVYSWQIAQEREFLQEDPHHKWIWDVKEMRIVTESDWRSSDGDEAIRSIGINFVESWRFASRIAKHHRSALQHLFFESCGESWRKSLERLTLWKRDRRDKRSAKRRRQLARVAKPTTTSQLDCRFVRRRWTMLPRKSWNSCEGCKSTTKCWRAI